MTRLLHIALVLIALVGVTGQSTALARMPPGGSAVSADQSMRASIAGMDCADMTTTSAHGHSPCKKFLLQCTSAVRCAPFALIAPAALPSVARMADRIVTASPSATRLWGRSYGPEPEPPNFLI